MDMAQNLTDTAVLPMGYVLDIWVYRDPDTRITLRSIRATTIQDGRGTEPIRYRCVTRGVWLWVSGFIVARKPGLRFAPSGLRRCEMVAARNQLDTAAVAKRAGVWIIGGWNL
jgi:hypothetical protein